MLDPITLKDLEPIYPFLVAAGMIAFIDVSLTRSRLFDGQRIARLVISIMLGVSVVSIVQTQQWATVMQVLGWSVATGLIGLLLWRVGMQRGRTERQEDFRREKERWRQDNN